MGNWFTAGGVVMWPLLLCSLLTLTLAVERGWFWLQIGRQQRGLVPQALSTFSQNPQRAIAKLKQHQQLPIARIFLSALTLGDATPEEFRLALESAAQAELPVLKRFQTLFETVAGVAPLLGLLGTVLGLMQTFSNLRLGETSGPAATGVTAGVSEALVSTASGLVVALVALLLANLFQGLYRRQRSFILEAGGKLEILYRRAQRQGLISSNVYLPGSLP
ncbi:MotA/TolQ/ExbB proton channel family protein [Nodosilinea sp. FACHB-131]|uniref:MotA/TolQ/ExbB proton channel family protein n=1 Tax=Cyanophyceae TaxID=3028117 RepID=UPI001682C63A|nr:MotA/TolQ/ExbB proton channel family protein [Nodosilinea sp. FACHB-131]MBD1872714.1 MotA/TolQ/ExbB proton channel family protein [Nodosilinea sp. FACHB-131]